MVHLHHRHPQRKVMANHLHRCQAATDLLRFQVEDTEVLRNHLLVVMEATLPTANKPRLDMVPREATGTTVATIMEVTVRLAFFHSHLLAM